MEGRLITLLLQQYAIYHIMDIYVSVLWYIACVDWLNGAATTYVYVTQTPDMRVTISGQNIIADTTM